MVRNPLRILVIPAILMIALLAAACGGDSATVAPPTTAPATPAATTAAPTAAATSAPSTRRPGIGAFATPTSPTAAATSAPSTAPPASPTEQPAQPVQKLSVVTTSNIAADWTRAVGGDRVDVFPLLPPNADPHTFQPGARDVTRVADADLVLSVGLSLEADWLDELIQNAARSPEAIVALGDGVDPIDFVEIFDEHDEHDHDAETHSAEIIGRLLVGDGETGAMSIIDLESGDVQQNAFDLGARAGRIYPTKSGRYAIAVSTDANTAHVFDGGVYMEPHGDHFDLVEGPVERLPLDLSGDRPVHLYVGGEWAAVFYDGSGDIALLNEHEIEEQGGAYSPPVINAGPHHGAAVPLEDDLFAVTTQHPEYATSPDDYRLPIGAEIVDLNGRTLHSETGCEGLHGDASNGHMAVFGCIGGVLFLEAHDGEYEGGFIAAPQGEPEDFRLTSVWGYAGLDHFFALGSAVGLYVVEPEDGAMEQLIPATENLNPINVAISHDGKALLVMMSDGELRMYDAHDLDLAAAASGFLAGPVETGFWARPHIATAPDAVFVTDSTGGRVWQLDAHDLEVITHWDVAGNPVKVAYVGILGETGGHEEHGHDEHDEHSEEDEHGHEEESDHHGHAHGELDPHFWFDPLRVKQAVSGIAARLSAIDPAGQDLYRQNAAAYNRELDDLHAWIEEHVAVLPEGRRVMVTSHDSFQYFAQRYGFEIAGAVLPSTTTDIEPTAQELAQLIETIEHEGVPAVFTEKSHNDRLARRVAEETGADLVGGLYTGSLSEPGGEAGTYLDLMRHNVDTIVEALR